MTLSLVLVDDWELRGDGSGDMRRIQFATMRKLNQVYENHGLRGSYNAETMQQLNHLRFRETNPELADLAHEWEDVVLDTYKRGHDIQLHVHSQWNGATYENCRWNLPGDWSILNHPRSGMVQMISECKSYLEGLIQRVDTSYKCQSFRSGAWAIAPSDHILNVLVEQGIVFDMSIVRGLKYERPLKLDYTNCEESLLPFYPDMKDARRVASTPENIISVPTFSFIPSRLAVAERDAFRLVSRINSRLTRKSEKLGSNKAANTVNDYSVWKPTLSQKINAYLQPNFFVADLSLLTWRMMREMIDAIRASTTDRHVVNAPIILENHTKDLVDFTAIERFAAYISKQPDLEVITLAELANRLQAGKYEVLTTQRAV